MAEKMEIEIDAPTATAIQQIQALIAKIDELASRGPQVQATLNVIATGTAQVANNFDQSVTKIDNRIDRSTSNISKTVNQTVNKVNTEIDQSVSHIDKSVTRTVSNIDNSVQNVDKSITKVNINIKESGDRAAAAVPQITSWIGAFIGIQTISQVMEEIIGRMKAIDEAREKLVGRRVDLDENLGVLQNNLQMFGPQDQDRIRRMVMNTSVSTRTEAPVVAEALAAGQATGFQVDPDKGNPVMTELLKFARVHGIKSQQQFSSLSRMMFNEGVKTGGDADQFLGEVSAGFATSDVPDFGAYVGEMVGAFLPREEMGGTRKKSFELYSALIATTKNIATARSGMEMMSRVSMGRNPKAMRALGEIGKEIGLIPATLDAIDGFEKLSQDQKDDLYLVALQKAMVDPKEKDKLQAAGVWDQRSFGRLLPGAGQAGQAAAARTRAALAQASPQTVGQQWNQFTGTESGVAALDAVRSAQQDDRAVGGPEVIAQQVQKNADDFATRQAAMGFPTDFVGGITLRPTSGFSPAGSRPFKFMRETSAKAFSRGQFLIDQMREFWYHEMTAAERQAHPEILEQFRAAEEATTQSERWRNPLLGPDTMNFDVNTQSLILGQAKDLIARQRSSGRSQSTVPAAAPLSAGTIGSNGATGLGPHSDAGWSPTINYHIGHLITNVGSPEDLPGRLELG